MAAPYYFKMVAGNDERELTLLSYPNMDKKELVELEAILMAALARAGFAQVEAAGGTIDPLVKALYGEGEALATPGPGKK